MGATWFLARAELRRRAAMWVFLAALVGLLGGAALATAAGARRTASAFDRFVTWSHEGDASVLGFGAPPGALARVAALPQVADSVEASIVAFQTHGSNEPYAFDTALIASPDERFVDGTYVRPIMVEGRLPDLASADEVIVNESMVDRLGLHAGDSFGLDVFTAAQLERAGSGEPLGPPEGPNISVSIAGVVRLPGDLTETAAQGLVFGSGAFFERWASQLPLEVGVLSVRLRSPSLSASFTAAAVSIVQGADVQQSDSRVASDATRVQAVGLAAFSAIVGLAALVAMGQSLSRVTVPADTDRAVYSAAGMTRRERALAMALPAVIAAAVGSLLAVVTAIAASSLFPRGLAQRAEPDPGVHADVLVLTLGGLLTFLALGVWVVVASRLRSAAHVPVSGRAPLSSRIAELGGLGAAASAGVRFALQRGRGARATPNASSVTAAVVGFTGVVGVVVFGASLGHLLATPALAGAPWDAEVGTVPAPLLGEIEAALDTPAFSGIATIRSAQVVVAGVTIEGYGFDVHRGTGFVSVLDGREPEGPDEAAFGSRTLARLGLGIGDAVEVGTSDRGPHRVQIVGRVALPVLNTDIDRIADGVILTRPGIDAVLGPGADPSVSLVLRFGDEARARRNLEAIAQPYGRDEFPSPSEPRELANMRSIGGVLTGIGVLTGLLAVVSIAHLLSVSVRRRRGELAVLRALGFRPGQVRAAVGWQALTVAAIALALGIPAGTVAGRVAWTAVARQLGVLDTITLHGLVVALVSAGFVLAAGVLSIGPGRQAARRRPAEVLRSD